jgi:hypothetical protein
MLVYSYPTFVFRDNIASIGFRTGFIDNGLIFPGGMIYMMRYLKMFNGSILKGIYLYENLDHLDMFGSADFWLQRNPGRK